MVATLSRASRDVTITPIQSPLQPQVAIPVTPVRPVIPVTPPAAPSIEINSGQVHAQILAQATQEAAGRQGGLAPLVADLAQAARNPNLPTPVRSAAAQVLAQTVPADARVSGGDVAKALSSSGLFLEARLAAQPQASPLGQDMKAGLLVLRQALAAWLAGAPRAPDARSPSKTPPPPYRAGGARAQPAATPSLAADAAPSAIGQRLLAETEAAVARQELLQIASLPAGEDQPVEAQVTRWMFEMPFVTPQGASVAQFEIARDGRGVRGEQTEPVWRVGFSLDIEPLGPIHARVSLSGRQAIVGLWAEHEAGLNRLQADREMLGQALARADFEAEIALHAGAPRVVAPPAGHLVDQTS
jgi:hypothetical protein